MNQNNSSLKTELQQGLSKLNLSVPNQALAALIDYLYLLEKWNQAYALTAVHDLNEMVVKHLLDSLTISPYLQGRHIIDVGTGAGLPGIPLALIHPDRTFVLLDSQRKKIQFLIQAQQVLPLKNVSIVHSRADAFKPAQCFDSVISRALTSLNEMIAMTQHFCCENGQFLAMKGQYPYEESATLSEHDYNKIIHQLKVPGLNAERHLVILQKKRGT